MRPPRPHKLHLKADGNFQLPLPSAGDFKLLLSSHDPSFPMQLIREWPIDLGDNHFATEL